MKSVGYHPDYVEERDSQKARAGNAVCHSHVNSIVKINIYVDGTSGGDIQSMIPVRKISSRKHQRIVLEGGQKIRYKKGIGDPPSTEKLAQVNVVIPSPWLFARLKTRRSRFLTEVPPSESKRLSREKDQPLRSIDSGTLEIF